MKRKIITIIVTLSVIATAVGATWAFAAGNSTRLDAYTATDTTKTTHQYNIRETSDYFVKNNGTDYVAVIPENCGTYEELASKELVELLYSSTGARISVKRDNELGAWNSSAKIISIGHTKQLSAAGVQYANKNLGTSGFVIKTVGKSVFVTGAESKGYGALYGTYELLTRLVGFREYGHNATYYESLDNVKLYDFDVTDIPDFDIRKDPCDDTGSSNNRYRMRFTGWGDFCMGVPGYGNGHSSFGYVDPEKYAYKTVKIKDDEGKVTEVDNENYHPEWFWYNSNGEAIQLSLSAHNNANSRAQMLQVALDVLISIVNDNPDLGAVSFSQQDDAGYDADDKNRAISKYGSLAGEWVAFCNDLMDGINNYFRQNNIDRKIKIFFYSYVFSSEPPIKNGQPGIKAKEGVVCLYCPIFMDEAESIVSKDNEAEKAELDGWLKVCEDSEVWIWLYNACFYNYMYPRWSFNGIAESARYAQSKGIKMYFVQSQTYSHKLWAFGELQNYLLSRLMWDTTLDQEELTKDWFEHYYGEVSGYMKQIFDLMEANYNYWNTTKDLHNGTDGYAYQSSQIWPLALVNQLLSLTDDALNAIEIYKEIDPALYNDLYTKIVFERIPFEYTIVEMYDSYYSGEYILNLKRNVKAEAIKIGALHWKENNPITNLWEEWGI